MFAQFGAAMFQCQALERRLALMLALIESPGAEQGSREELQDLLDKLHRQTLGTLIERYRKSGLIPEGYEPRLREALELRNLLAHRYFAENVELLVLPAGRDDMISKLNGHAAWIREVEQELAAFTERWHAKHGITAEAVQEATAAIMKGGV